MYWVYYYVCALDWNKGKRKHIKKYAIILLKIQTIKLTTNSKQVSGGKFIPIWWVDRSLLSNVWSSLLIQHFFEGGAAKNMADLS